MPVASKTAAIPPRPAARASLAAKQPPIPLAKKWRERIESSCYPGGVDHAPKVVYAAPGSPCIPDSFVAFSPPHRVFSSDSVVQARALTLVLRVICVILAFLLLDRDRRMRWSFSARRDHPRHAEAVVHHAEAWREERLGQWHGHLPAVGQRAKRCSASDSLATVSANALPWKVG